MRNRRSNPDLPATLVAALLAVALLTPTLLVAQSELSATLEVAPELEDGQSVNLTFTLANQGDQDLEVLTWLTPLEGVYGEIFRVERDGEPVPYRGILAHRAAPSEGEYVVLDAGEASSAEVDLADSYDFSQPGEYTIAFLPPPVGHVVAKGAPKAKQLDKLKAPDIPADAVTTVIASASEPPAFAKEVAQDVGEEAKTTNFNGCTSQRRDILTDSQTTALVTSAFVVSRLQNATAAERAADALYDTWFGTYTAGRFATVQGNLEDIHDYLLGTNVEYDCTGNAPCQSNWNAYVYSGGAYEIFLCPNFWNNPDDGQVSKHSILYHETSHEAAGTDDHTYGAASCQALANSDPAKAIDNADSYEFYYSNTPIAGSEHLVLALAIVLALVAVEWSRRRKGRSAV